MNDDGELLRQYVRTREEAAFAELVRRHVDLVYAVALRQAGGDAHLARDVVQTVFVALARKAATLAGRGVLAGWLYRATHYAAADAVRAERRRKAREAAAMTIKDADMTGDAVNWEAVRPLLDAAIAELSDVDRDAVVLRFIGGRSLAEVGARLQLSENAARMRVERALEKLQRLLAKRGVRSTGAAVAVAVSAQVNVAAPTGLGGVAANAAVSALGGGLGAAAGWLGMFTAAKTSAIVAGAVALGALGVVVVQRGELREAERRLAESRAQREEFAAKAATSTAQLAQVERRVAEAERDNGELLRAVEAAKAERATMAAKTTVAKQAEEERLSDERAYQQELARRRAEEAKADAVSRHEAAQLDPTGHYRRLIQLGREQAVRGEFRRAMITLNEAMRRKPADVAVEPELKEFQAELERQNVPREVALVSDGKTLVSIMGARSPVRFTSTLLRMLPGNYEVVGRRPGYADVVIPLRLRNGEPLAPITVICEAGR